MNNINLEHIKNNESYIIISLILGILFLIIITIVSQLCCKKNKKEYEEPLL